MKSFSGFLLAAICLCISALPFNASADTVKSGAVLMHAEGDSPTRNVRPLEEALEQAGYLVINLEMAWSAKRDYDVDVATAEVELSTAIADLRARGAEKIFIIGHSLAASFALYFAGKEVVDGVIGIAPDGNISATSEAYKRQQAKSIEKARELVAEGKGDRRTSLKDYQGSRGSYSIKTTPAIYLTWFDPAGPFNMIQSARKMKLYTSVLWISARKDKPVLKQLNPQVVAALPPNPLNEAHEVNSEHLRAPRASIDKILRWLEQVINTGS